MILSPDYFERISLLSKESWFELWECNYTGKDSASANPLTILYSKSISMNSLFELKHANIVQVFGYFLEQKDGSEPTIAIVMEYIQPPVLLSLLKQATLYDALHHCKNEKIFENMIIKMQFMIDILNGLIALQSISPTNCSSHVLQSKYWYINESLQLQLQLVNPFQNEYSILPFDTQFYQQLSVLFTEIMERKKQSISFAFGNESVYPTELIYLIQEMQYGNWTLSNLCEKFVAIKTKLLHSCVTPVKSNCIQQETVLIDTCDKYKELVTVSSHQIQCFFGLASILFVTMMSIFVAGLGVWFIMDTNHSTILSILLFLTNGLLIAAFYTVAFAQLICSYYLRLQNIQWKNMQILEP